MTKSIIKAFNTASTDYSEFSETDLDIFRSLLEEYVENFEIFQSEIYGGAFKKDCKDALKEFNTLFVKNDSPLPRVEDSHLFALKCFVVGVKCSYIFPETEKMYDYKDVRDTIDRLGLYFDKLEEYTIPDKSKNPNEQQTPNNNNSI